MARKKNKRFAGDVLLNSNATNNSGATALNQQGSVDQEGVPTTFERNKFANETRFMSDYDGKNQFFANDPNDPANKRPRDARQMQQLIDNPDVPQDRKDQFSQNPNFKVPMDLTKYGKEGFGMKDVKGFRKEGFSDKEILKEMEDVRREGIDNVGPAAYSMLQRDKLGDFDTTTYGAQGFGRKDIYELERQGKSPKQIAGIINSFEQQGDMKIGPKALKYRDQNVNYKSDNFAMTNPQSRASGNLKLGPGQDQQTVNYKVGDRLMGRPDEYSAIQETYGDLSKQTGINFQEVGKGTSADIKHTFGNTSTLFKGADGTPFQVDPKTYRGLHIATPYQVTDGEGDVAFAGNQKYETTDTGALQLDEEGRKIKVPSSELLQKGFGTNPTADAGETSDYQGASNTSEYYHNEPKITARGSAKNLAHARNSYKNVLTHEIGHALGFGENRTKMRDADGNYITRQKGGKTQYKYGDYHNPSYSVMSYEHDRNRGSGFTEHDLDQLYHMGHDIKNFYD